MAKKRPERVILTCFFPQPVGLKEDGGARGGYCLPGRIAVLGKKIHRMLSYVRVSDTQKIISRRVPKSTQDAV